MTSFMCHPYENSSEPICLHISFCLHRKVRPNSVKAKSIIVKIMDICNNDSELCSPFDSESSKTRRSDVLKEAVDMWVKDVQ